MTSSLVICSIPDDVKAELKTFRFAKSTNMTALILKIDRNTHEMIVDEKFEDCSLEEICEEVSHQQPRFILLSWQKSHADGRTSYPLSLVYYCPNGSSPELQMLYAGSRNHLVNECQLTKNTEIRDIDELTDEFLDRHS